MWCNFNDRVYILEQDIPGVFKRAKIRELPASHSRSLLRDLHAKLIVAESSRYRIERHDKLHVKWHVTLLNTLLV